MGCKSGQILKNKHEIEGEKAAEALLLKSKGYPTEAELSSAISELIVVPLTLDRIDETVLRIRGFSSTFTAAIERRMR